MESILKHAIFLKYGLAVNHLQYEESENRAFLTFVCNSTMYIAVKLKSGEQVVFYKMDKAVNPYED